MFGDNEAVSKTIINISSIHQQTAATTKISDYVSILSYWRHCCDELFCWHLNGHVNINWSNYLDITDNDVHTDSLWSVIWVDNQLKYICIYMCIFMNDYVLIDMDWEVIILNVICWLFVKIKENLAKRMTHLIVAFWCCWCSLPNILSSVFQTNIAYKSLNLFYQIVWSFKLIQSVVKTQSWRF